MRAVPGQRVEHVAAVPRPSRRPRGPSPTAATRTRRPRRPRVLEQQAQVDVEDAAGVLGALDVAPDPVQRLGDAAQHAVTAPACCCCCCCCAAGCPAAADSLSQLRPMRRCARGRGGRRGLRADAAATRPRRSPASTQVSFEPPPWLEFTTSEPSRQRDPGQAAGQHPDVVAVVDRERAQVDVPRRDRRRRSAWAPSTAGRPAGRSSRAGRRSARSRSSSELGAGGLRPDHQALAAGAVDRLDDQLVQAVEHLLERAGSSSRQVSTLGSTGSSLR